MSKFISETAQSADQPHEMARKLCAAAADRKQLEDSSPEEARALRREWGNPFAPPACAMAATEDIQIPVADSEILARVYRPLSANGQLQPALVYFHGGGFVVGSVEQYDSVCQQLAHHSQCVVISVEYVLAPAHNIEQIHAEGFAAWRWLQEHAAQLGLNEARMAIAGDSAGGNLAISVTLACKRAQTPMPAYQVLIYPSVDLGMSFPSVAEFASGYYLTRAGMSWFRSHYLDSREQASHPQLSYLQCDLAGLPPAYVITAGFDPLRDEGEAYANRLRDFGVPVVHECFTDMIHAFVSFAGGIPPGMEAIRRIGVRLGSALAVCG